MPIPKTKLAYETVTIHINVTVTINHVLEQRNRNHKMTNEIAINSEVPRAQQYLGLKCNYAVKGNVSVDVYMYYHTGSFSLNLNKSKKYEFLEYALKDK